MAAIGCPETAHRSFGGSRVVANMISTTHFDDRAFFEGAWNTALHEISDGSILHRYVAGRADQVRLFETHFGSYFIIVFEA